MRWRKKPTDPCAEYIAQLNEEAEQRTLAANARKLGVIYTPGGIYANDILRTMHGDKITTGVIKADHLKSNHIMYLGDEPTTIIKTDQTIRSHKC